MSEGSPQLERVRRAAAYVRRSQEALEAARDNRAAAIRDAADSGESNAAIARAAELSDVSILRIIVNSTAQES